MPSQETIQALIQARLAGVKEASLNRDVDALMSWYTKDAVFSDKFNGIHLEGADAIRPFYAGAYAAMPAFRVPESSVTGFSPEFVVAEMRCEGDLAVEFAGLKAGDTMHLKGVNLFWWRWEGEGEWDGSLSDEAVRKWKIVREHTYYQSGPKSS